MLETGHRVILSDARKLGFIPSGSINMVVTSPPYPMIEMWDELFKEQNEEIKKALAGFDGRKAFNLMHKELDKVWNELYRVLTAGGIACINVGDATRKIGNNFQLYPNQARILSHCFKKGFDILPVILWRKQTNAPNKFMGSGMLPAGAYVTLEHEYILILRKKDKRDFIRPDDKLKRRRSAFFWEERNKWFSDVWDFKGTRQNMNHKDLRERSAAYPFELAYRLINMYSVKGDTILDPFLGTGTTMFAAMASGRNSIGVEINKAFPAVIHSEAAKMISSLNGYISERLKNHLLFVDQYRSEKGDLKYTNKHYHFPVMSRQEIEIVINYLEGIEMLDDNTFSVNYYDNAIIEKQFIKGLDAFSKEKDGRQLSLEL